jgi:hypothetical protein
VFALPNWSFPKLTESFFDVASGFTFGLSVTLGGSANSSEMRSSKSPFAARSVVTSFTIPVPAANQRSIVIGLGDVCSLWIRNA